MPYTITAVADGRALRQTRGMPASAAVLAMKWIDDGYADVRIVVDERPYDLIAFRQRLGRMKNHWRQRT